ncbi:ATP-binding cassette domain-containing protein [Streptomyces solicathayae]|uniref:ATP-binding cassette domain-containing protein n=1 Tax=Streptomyces solicathayae TaxID=3081768 RepID=A0ABZ0LNN9_9ACTN|nr:ATP-binding cassette domain-containing protein [Streptomyces sp. HUAS YS2]WOX20900.1 ATP-binding cassette domain-containing protein [Streptomyces sp. HUAS YS2]
MRLEAVSKRYGRGGWVLREVHAEVPPGATVAFTGGNGSGKSTLLRILAGVSRPTGGAVTGRPPVVGYVPDRFAPEGRLSARSYLTHMGRVRGLGTGAADARARRLLDRLALVGGADAQLRTLSKGNAQKVALAQALLVPPGLLVLDEPWSGLDTSAHGVLAEIMAEVAEAGGAVAFTDHREAVTRAHASVAYAVEGGRVRPAEPPAPRAPVAEAVFAHPDDGRVPEPVDWAALPGVRAASGDAAGTRVRVERPHADALLRTALDHGWSVAALSRDPAPPAGTPTPKTGGRA